MIWESSQKYSTIANVTFCAKNIVEMGGIHLQVWRQMSQIDLWSEFWLFREFVEHSWAEISEVGSVIFPPERRNLGTCPAISGSNANCLGMEVFCFGGKIYPLTFHILFLNESRTFSSDEKNRQNAEWSVIRHFISGFGRLANSPQNTWTFSIAPIFRNFAQKPFI